MAIQKESFTDGSGLALVGVPSSAGARQPGQERAPAVFREAGLMERLRAAGLDVLDLGNLPAVAFRPDPGHARGRNADRVTDVARRTAARVGEALASGRRLLVLGGDCSLSLGVIAGLLRHRERVGLLYFDGDVDLNTPETTCSGIFDGMVLAHVLGRGAEQLSGIGPRRPLLSDEDVALFGYDEESGWIDPAELEMLAQSRLAKYPASRVRGNAVAAASDARKYLERRSDAIIVHFDVDVMSLPAADVPHPNGLDVDTAFAALEVFVAAPKCAAVVVTEFNPERDPDGSQAERVVDGLATTLGACAAPA